MDSRLPFVWFIALISLSLLIIFGLYVSQDYIVACRYAYTYGLDVNGETKLDNSRLIPEDPPTITVNIWYGYHLANGKVSSIWREYLTENNADIYFPRGVDDQSGAILEGVLFGLSFPYQDCNWIMVRVYPERNLASS